MALHGVTEAAKLAGVSRPTIYKHLKSGKLSATQDAEGNAQIETAELIRVYGELRPLDAGDDAEAPAVDTGQQAALQVAGVEIEALRRENALLREQLGKAEARETMHLETIRRTTMLLPAPKPEGGGEAGPATDAKPPPRRGLFGRLFRGG